MNVDPTTAILYGGGAALVLGASAAFGLALRPTGPLGRAIQRYIARLEIECRFQFFRIDGRQMFVRQLAALVLAVLTCVAVENPWLWILPPLVVIGPALWLRYLRKKRVERIEQQLDGWLLVLSNLLKAAGGLGDALVASVDLVRPPLRQELEWVLKEIRLGAVVDDALRQMAGRVKSSILAAVVTLLVVGRRTGGELPGLLESAAAALREMARLEGVIKTKTASGRNQTLVMACAPPVLVILFKKLDPHFFDPLFESLIGYSIIVVAILLWAVAIYSARKILNVDY